MRLKPQTSRKDLYWCSLVFVILIFLNNRIYGCVSIALIYECIFGEATKIVVGVLGRCKSVSSAVVCDAIASWREYMNWTEIRWELYLNCICNFWRAWPCIYVTHIYPRLFVIECVWYIHHPSSEISKNGETREMPQSWRIYSPVGYKSRAL